MYEWPFENTARYSVCLFRNRYSVCDSEKCSSLCVLIKNYHISPCNIFLSFSTFYQVCLTHCFLSHCFFFGVFIIIDDYEYYYFSHGNNIMLFLSIKVTVILPIWYMKIPLTFATSISCIQPSNLPDVLYMYRDSILIYIVYYWVIHKHEWYVLYKIHE